LGLLELLELLGSLKLLKSFRLKNLLSLFFAVALLVLSVRGVFAQEQNTVQAPLANQATDKLNGRGVSKDRSKEPAVDSHKDSHKDSNKNLSKESSKDLNKDSNKDLGREAAKDLNNDLNKGLIKEDPSRQNLPRLRESDERFAVWMERVERRKKMRELENLRIEQGLPPRPNFPARGDGVRGAQGARLDLRSILQSPKREDDQRERAIRQELKAQMEVRRQEMQALRERRSQMSVEERRALRKQIRDASQGMPPPPRR
jgi:hypothetical protein